MARVWGRSGCDVAGSRVLSEEGDWAGDAREASAAGLGGTGRDGMGILARGHCKLEREREAEDQVLSPGCTLLLPASPVVSPDDWVNDELWVWMPEVPTCCCTPDSICASVSLSVQGASPFPPSANSSQVAPHLPARANNESCDLV